MCSFIHIGGREDVYTIIVFYVIFYNNEISKSGEKNKRVCTER